MYILSIDPGNEQTAYCLLDKDLRPIEKDKVVNEELLKIIHDLVHKHHIEHFAIEMVASYGLAVGKTVFETCFWIGRFYQKIHEYTSKEPTLIFRKDEKMSICGSMQAKDGNIRRALIDMFAQHDFKNGKGTKKKPDWFYGFRADMWQAYAVGYTYYDKYIKGNR